MNNIIQNNKRTPKNTSISIDDNKLITYLENITKDPIANVEYNTTINKSIEGTINNVIDSYNNYIKYYNSQINLIEDAINYIATNKKKNRNSKVKSPTKPYPAERLISRINYDLFIAVGLNWLDNLKLYASVYEVLIHKKSIDHIVSYQNNYQNINELFDLINSQLKAKYITLTHNGRTYDKINMFMSDVYCSKPKDNIMQKIDVSNTIKNSGCSSIGNKQTRDICVKQKICSKYITALIENDNNNDDHNELVKVLKGLIIIYKFYLYKFHTAGINLIKKVNYYNEKIGDYEKEIYLSKSIENPIGSLSSNKYKLMNVYNY